MLPLLVPESCPVVLNEKLDLFLLDRHSYPHHARRMTERVYSCVKQNGRNFILVRTQDKRRGIHRGKLDSARTSLWAQ